jgi:hypothetical protein
MFRISPIALALVLAAPVVHPAPAAEQFRNGLRNSDAEVSAMRKHRKHSVSHVRSNRRPDKEPYAGYRTDVAGNPYFYYRVGGDSPFGPGRGLRPPLSELKQESPPVGGPFSSL